MSHFAKIENGIVTEVIVAEQDFIDTLDGRWIQTSYNANIRKNYAGIGYTYDDNLNAFIPPKPFSSWILNNTTCQWEAPVSMPSDGQFIWDESKQNWIEI